MLSICIPTCNRFPFLEWTLGKLMTDFSIADIAVSDNASTDDTRSLSRLPLRYMCQPRNIGAFPNMLAAFQMAKGDYAVYCADDDYLLPGPVAAGIAYLDSHPEVAAFCAPCEIWNEVTQQPYWNAYMVDHPRTFKAGEGMDLFNFIIQRHVWPEHWIYRVPVPLKPRTRAYWAFADIPDILERGAIHFSPTPFYRNLLVHPVGERVQLGNQQCLTDFDEYRAGLEVLAYGLFGDGLPYAARHRIHEMIQFFICQRMDRAAKIFDQLGRGEEAQLMRKRLAIASPVRDTLDSAA